MIEWIKEEKLKQLDLEFKGHPVVDTRFKRGTVYLSCPTENDMIIVSNIWAITDEQAFAKAARIVRVKKYEPERSLFVRSS